MLFNRSTTRDVLRHSFAQDPPNIDEDNELDDKLRFGMHLSFGRTVGCNTVQGIGSSAFMNHGNPHAAPNSRVVISDDRHFEKRPMVEGDGSRSTYTICERPIFYD